MSEWKEYRLGDFAEVQTGPFGSQLHASDYVAVGIPSLMPVNIGERLNIKPGDLVYVKKEDIERLCCMNPRQRLECPYPIKGHATFTASGEAI